MHIVAKRLLNGEFKRDWQLSIVDELAGLASFGLGPHTLMIDGTCFWTPGDFHRTAGRTESQAIRGVELCACFGCPRWSRLPASRE
jgi:hypothetical protein